MQPTIMAHKVSESLSVAIEITGAPTKVEVSKLIDHLLNTAMELTKAYKLAN